MNDYNIIGISGKIGSGKDLVGKMIQYLSTAKGTSSYKEFYKRHIISDQVIYDPVYKIRKFADPLKDCVCIILGCSREQLEDHAFKEKDLGVEWDHLTPRKILQRLGTEGGRVAIHTDIWVNSTFANIGDSDKVVLTDMRFPNELESVKSRGGLTIRINREGHNDTGDHPSETALDGAEFNIVINNDGSILDLYEKIKKVL